KWTNEPSFSWRYPGFAQNDTHPVVCVNWSDAKAYVVWLSNRTGKSYRLLSEVEREYVARAGTTSPFWWGGQISPQEANYDAKHAYGGGPVSDSAGGTVTVHSFSPNPWGLYNVHGNVWDWTEDCWDPSNGGASRDGSARHSGDCSVRALRGGSWKD